MGAVQATPQAPQLAASVNRLTQPLSQAERLALQATSQSPALHTARPLTVLGQPASQVPQWSAFVEVSTQLPSQSMVPCGQSV
jgi:hypothetical protein